MLVQIIIPIYMPMPCDGYGELPEWALWIVIACAVIGLCVCVWAIIELIKE